jgi:hypothetical protein
VGTGLLAKAACQALKMLDVPTSSQASLLPQNLELPEIVWERIHSRRGRQIQPFLCLTHRIREWLKPSR